MPAAVDFRCFVSAAVYCTPSQYLGFLLYTVWWCRSYERALAPNPLPNHFRGSIEYNSNFKSTESL